MKRIFLIGLALFPAIANAQDFMGLVVGEPFSIPKCATIDISKSFKIFAKDNEQSTLPCWINRPDANAGLPHESTYRIEILPSHAKSPDGIKFVHAIIIEGKLEGVTASTDGIIHQDKILDALISKYGTPSLSKQSPIQNMAGAKFIAKMARWNQNEVTIDFMGVGSKIDSGLISVMSKKGMAYTKERAAQIRNSAPSF